MPVWSFFMFEMLLFLSCGLAVFASALVAGIFLAFSDFIMRSLLAARAEGGIESMQIINREVYRSIFMVLLMGMVPYSVLLTVLAFFVVSGMALYCIAAGALTYILGVVLLTGFCNVPMNQKLDGMDFSSEEAKVYWEEYCLVWTRWNHVRTVCSILASVLFFTACIYLG